MPRKAQPRTLKAYEKAVQHWAMELGVDVRGIRDGSLSGAYTGAPPLDVIEFFVHEVSHVVVLGNDRLESFLEEEDDLPGFIENTVSHLSVSTSDSLEIDTAVVTFLVGCRLGFWSDYELIRRSCRENLRGYKLAEENEINLEIAFEKRIHDPNLERMATLVKGWLQKQRRRCS